MCIRDRFAVKIKALPRHARDEHEWDGRKCDFHLPRVCSCKNCEDEEKLQCEGKDYHTRYLLSCPLHSLAYEIECHARASMSEQLLHAILKRGHSNWLEVCQCIYSLQTKAYPSGETSLCGFNRACPNMTYMYKKRGPQYHWVVELFKRLKLPVFDGVQATLEEFSELRKKKLDRQITEKCKRRRIQLKVEQTKDAQCRKAWSKKHGRDTYGDDDSDDDDLELKPKASKRRKKDHSQLEGCAKHVGPLLPSVLTTASAPTTKGRMALQLHSTKKT